MADRDEGWLAEYRRLVDDIWYIGQLGEKAGIDVDTLPLEDGTEILYVVLTGKFGQEFKDDDENFPCCYGHRDALRRVLDHYRRENILYRGIVLDTTAITDVGFQNRLVETISYSWLLLHNEKKIGMKLVTAENSRIRSQMERVLGTLGLETYINKEDALASYTKEAVK